MNGQMEDTTDLTVVRFSDIVTAGVMTEETYEKELVTNLVRAKFNETAYMAPRSRPHCAHCGRILMMHTTAAHVETIESDTEKSYRLGSLFCEKPECFFVARMDAPRNSILWVGFE